MTDTRERQISDLLALRDGELSEAAAAAVHSRPGATALQRELDALRQSLNALPDPTPDAALFERIRTAARKPASPPPAAVAPRPARIPTRFVPYAAAAGLILALGAGLLGVNTARQSAAPERTVAVPEPGPETDAALRVLHERSRRLEPLLASADRRDRTEQALRLRIADLDNQISSDPDAPLSEWQEQRLWGQRVALLESLAEVRRARATVQPAVF